MNKEQSSKAAAELDLNDALVNADISNGYEEHLALFDHLYDENVEAQVTVIAAEHFGLAGKSTYEGQILSLLNSGRQADAP
jgi:hypothetical protein